MLQNLIALVDECGEENWDGYGSDPVTARSLAEAERLLMALPSDLPAPEISAHPDGEVELEWYRSPIRVLAVSIGPDGTLTYAGRFGPDSEMHGREQFDGQIPENVVEAARRVFKGA